MGRRHAATLALAAMLLPELVGAQECLERVVRWPYGVNNHVATDASMAVMGNGAAVQIVDLADPTSPVVVGEVHTTLVVNAVAIAEDRAFAATWDGLYVIDIGTPSTPSIVGWLGFASSKNVAAIEVVADTVYLAGGDLDIIDVSTSSTPTLLGSWTELYTRDVAVSGGYAVVAVFDEGLRVLEVSDPTSPTVAGQLDLGPDRRAHALDVTGSYAIVAGYDTSVPGYRLFSVNLGDPANPALVTVTPGGGGDIVVRNGLAVASDIIGVAVWDVADPATPVYQGGVGIHYNDQKRIAAVDGYALASNDSYGVTVVDLADPTVPTIVAEVGVPGKAMEADATDELLVIAAEIRGLRFVDVADPAQPVELGILDVPMIPMDAAVEGDLAYATGYGGTGFVVVDISDPGSAAVIGSIPGLWGGDAIKVRDGHAYVACGDPGLRIIDVSVPSAPVEVSSLVLPAGTPPFGTMDVAGGVAVLWPGDEVVYVVDVSDPAAPFIASTIDTNYALHGGVSLKGSWLFIGDALLRIFDLRNPSAPVEKQPYVPVGSGGFLPIVETAGSVAYLASTWQPDSPGIEAVNVGDPTSPALMGASAETFALSGFAFSRWAVHAVSEFSGFDTFAPCQGPLFADDFESGNTTAWSSTVP